MIRKLLIPLAAATLLAGCVSTAPYGYRDGARGDYYYGRPSVEYRYHGMYGYPGYGYPYYGPYSSRYSRFYGHPYYGYGYPGGYYNPYYGYPYHPPVYRPRPDDGSGGDTGGTVDTRPDGGPWRNLDDLRRRRSTDGTATGMAPITRPSMPQPSSQPRSRSSSGSAMGEMMRRRTESRNEVEE